MSFRSGFVGIVGRPNVGKSTILNYYLDQKIAITSAQPQTTRHRILGVLNTLHAQINFLDSPGLYKPGNKLERLMFEAAKDVLETADVLVAVLDASSGIHKADALLFDRLGELNKPILLALNKVDIVKKPKLLPLMDQCVRMNLFEQCIPVSARKGDQMDVLLDAVQALLPEGPQWHPEEQKTDQSVEQQICEFIREQILRATHEEIPHAAAVRMDLVEEAADLIKIHASIIIERPGQKAILIGKGGSMLKHIGSKARREIEHMLGKKVFLDLWVKVIKDWRSNDRVLKELGYLR